MSATSVTINEIVSQYVVSVNETTEQINVQVNEVLETTLVTINEIGTRGLSAYEIAVSNGYIGTVTQWISSLSSGNISVKNEVPTGLINGINNTFFSLNNFTPESVEVYLNGLNQKKITEFQTIGTNKIILTISPSTNETVLINYLKS